MRRTRKPAVVWLPNDGGNTVGAGANVFKQFQLDIPGGSALGVTGIIPLTVDFPAALGVQDTLSDYEGSGYRLRRIVGKCFCTAEQDQEPPAGSPSGVIVTAGFIVLRVDPNGTPLAGIAGFLNYSPQILDSERDPWIWRRSWILSNGGLSGTGGPTGFNAEFPFTNTEYGSVADGPHIDAKTARAIKDEERLFFVAAGLALDGAQGTDLGVRIILDYRLLASMYKASGNRRNASR